MERGGSPSGRAVPRATWSSLDEEQVDEVASSAGRERDHMIKTGLVAVAIAASATGAASAGLVYTVGGQTNVLLDLDLLSSAANLDLTGVSDGVIVPGNLGPDSVAFAITGPDAADHATTFNYDSDDFFGTFNGTIDHRGTVTFNDSIAVGNFEIAYVDDTFVVIDTFGGLGRLFDVAITGATPGLHTLEVTGDLLVSASFAQALLDLGLATSDLTGADVGDAFIQGYNSSVPAPGALALLGLAGLGSRRRRR